MIIHLLQTFDAIVTSCHPWAGITSWVLGSLWPLHDSCLFENTLGAFSIGRERLNSKIQRGQDTKPFAENHFWSCFASHMWAQQCCLNHAVIEHMKQWKPLTSSRMLQCIPIARQTCQSWILTVLTAYIPQNLLWFKGFKRNVSKIPQCGMGKPTVPPMAPLSQPPPPWASLIERLGQSAMSLKLGMAVAWTWIFLIVFLVTAPIDIFAGRIGL